MSYQSENIRAMNSFVGSRYEKKSGLKSRFPRRKLPSEDELKVRLGPGTTKSKG